jgi:cation:H+ antiporter
MLAIVPEALYGGLLSHSPWLLWAWAVGALAVLGAAADRAVWAAVRLAAELGMSRIVIGATIVSLGTTAPEVSVSVVAAIRGQGGLALGNAVGSVICNTALIFGLGCVLTQLPIDRAVLRRQSFMHLAAVVSLIGIVVILAAASGTVHGLAIPRGVGVAFLGALAAYMYLTIRWARGGLEALLPADAHESQTSRRAKTHGAWMSFIVLAVGLAAVVLASDALVGSVVALSRHYGVPEDVLAVTLVAFGTSVPELATAIVSVIRRQGELMIGNILGANTLCILWVTGASAAVAPVEVPASFFYLHLPLMGLVAGLFTVFVLRSGTHFRRRQGAGLLAIYAAYIAALAVYTLKAQ